MLLHEWHYAPEDHPKAVLDEAGMPGIDKTEPVANLTTWVFEEGTFIPQAKITEEGTYSIITDYLGTPVQAFDENSTQVWQRELDIYGKARVGDSVFCPWGFQNQYYDEETGLAGNNPNLYAYTHDSNFWVDPFGLECSVANKLSKHADDALKEAKLTDRQLASIQRSLDRANNAPDAVQKAFMSLSYIRYSVYLQGLTRFLFVF